MICFFFEKIFDPFSKNKIHILIEKWKSLIADIFLIIQWK